MKTHTVSVNEIGLDPVSQTPSQVIRLPGYSLLHVQTSVRPKLIQVNNLLLTEANDA